MALPEDYVPMFDDIKFIGGRPHLYKLVDRVAVPCSLRDWLVFFEAARQVALDEVSRADSDPVTVSTVFLGIDHGWFDGQVVLFETMVFGGPLDQHQVRYCTYGEALRGHAELLAEVTIEGTLTAELINARIAAIVARAKQESSEVTKEQKR